MAIRFDPFLDEEDYLGGGYAPTSAMTPPFAPSTTAVVAQPPKPKTALEQWGDLSKQRPVQSDPLLKPKPIDRVLGGLAGAAAGFGAGYLNSGRRGRVVDPNMAGNLASGITNRKYNSAMRDFNQKEESLRNQAGIEQAVSKNQRDQSLNDARIKSAQATEGYAKAHTEALSKPKPIDAPKNYEEHLTRVLNDPNATPESRKSAEDQLKGMKAKAPTTPHTIEQQIIGIRDRTDLLPEQKDALVNKAVEDYNALHPKQPITRLVTDDSGMVRAVSFDPTKGTTAATDVGAYGKKTKAAASPGAVPSASGALSPSAQGVLDGKVDYWGMGQKKRDAVRDELLRANTSWEEPAKSTVSERNAASGASSAIESLKELKTTLQENEKYVGPVAGLQAYNPWSDARKVQAKIDLVKQRVGKTLEGGVLRKEDEDKYKRILATLMDEPSTAAAKVDGLIATLERDTKIAADERQKAGRTPKKDSNKPVADPLGIRGTK